MRNSIYILLSMIVFFACKEDTQNNSLADALPYYNEASFTPHWLSVGDKALDTFHRISPFELTNQEGEIISEETFADKIYVTNFFFTICPGICPKLTDNMSILQDAFINDDDVLFLSHSVTPERDSVPVLKHYAEERGILSHKWHLATGDVEEIYKLGRIEYFVEEDLGLENQADEFLHTENFVLMDQRRHIRGIYNGLKKTAIQQLIKDIKTLQEAK